MWESLLNYGLLFIFLYAETHYRFRYFFSWLRKREPEIIADMPSRIRHSNELPVLVIIKDAHIYPVQVQTVTIYLRDKVLERVAPQIEITQPYYEYQILVATSDLQVGGVELDVEIGYKVNGRIRICRNDNHRGTSHDALKVYISDWEIPRIKNALLGEVHAHTNFTSDQVEFGASVAATGDLAKAMGLDFYCATDHSYDLDDMEDNYLVNDPQLGKWTKFLETVEQYNKSTENFLVIPGEEVTVRNCRGRNVHCLVYDCAEFFPGSGDGADVWFRWKSELSLSELTEMVPKSAAIFAAHPFEQIPFLQQIFIGRDRWNTEDCMNPHLNGLQIINGTNDKQINAALNEWKKLLLDGQRITGIAGNDAHGNFARFRQVGFPFFTMREHHYHLFGKWFTGIYGAKAGDKATILGALKSGNCYMGNGPAIRIVAAEDGGRWYDSGETITKPSVLKIECVSSPEFGQFKDITVFLGEFKGKTERMLFNTLDAAQFEFEHDITLHSVAANGYIRAQIKTTMGNQAITNPIWINADAD